VERTKFSVKLITVLSGFSGIKAYGAILGILLACGLGVPVPEDITLISAGILAALKSIKLYGAIGVGLVGVLSGDAFLFFLGRLYGYRVFKLPLFRTVFTEKRIQLARQKVLSNSKFICFTGRFLPGLRAPIFLTSGIMGVRPVVFLSLDATAACISVPVWVYLGWYFGSNIDRALTIAIRTQKYFVGGVTLLLLTYILWKIRTAKNEEKLLNKVDAPPIPDEVIVQSPQE
jgi:membrane protein DedA with SNARE-associated domain